MQLNSETLLWHRFFKASYRAVRSRFLTGLLIFGLLSLSADVALADPFLARESDNEIGMEPTPGPTLASGKLAGRKEAFPGYGAFRTGFAAQCERFHADGRSAELDEMLESLLLEHKDIPTRRSLYRTMLCKRKTAAGKKQQSPQTELLALVSSMGMRIAKNKAVGNEAVDALKPLFALFASRKDTASAHYFLTIKAYWEAALSEKLQEAPVVNPEVTKQEERKKRKQLEDMF